MHLGLEGVVPFVLYVGGILSVLLSLFWRPIVGIYYLAPLIPLQTIRYHLNSFPLGQSVVDIVLLAVIIGAFRERRSWRLRTPLDSVLMAYALYTLASLFWGSLSMGLPLPLSIEDQRLMDWKDLFEMPVMMLVAASVVRTSRQTFILLAVMCLAVIQLDRGFWATVSAGDFSQYSNDLRDAGSMGYVGSNGLAAFEAQFITLLLGLGAFKVPRWQRLAMFGLAGFSAICLIYSLSRGGYAAFLAGWLFIGVVRRRTLLVLLVAFLLSWTALVPGAVRQRVFMTQGTGGELDATSQERVVLWRDALEVVRTSPIFGTGYNTYAYMHRVGEWRDTHNIYLKVLVETGLIGLTLLLLVQGKLWWIGWKAYRTVQDPLLRGLGLGLCGWIVSTAVANSFGDAWTFLQVDGYLWLIAGCVCRAIAVQAQAESRPSVENDEAPVLSQLAPQELPT
ncbi:MAG: O-antigen ligase family protein [Acidobacteria bacterium]|nr:O-antigen ligase family protein [Acidobacteriota bacterium]